MTYSTELAALAHIEATLAESYRKEIDQEENLWRSLPFFAGTLALELAALFQVIGHLPMVGAWASVPAQALVVLSLLCSLGALGVLAASILPAKFRYVSSDVALLDYTLGLMADERLVDDLDRPAPALHALQESLARQYAAATDNNRRINDQTEKLRSVAGLLTIFAVISTLVLIAVTFDNYVPVHAVQGASIEPARQPTVSQSTVSSADIPAAAPYEPSGGDGGDPADGDPAPAAPAPAAPAHAGGHQGVVHDARGTKDARAAARGR